MKSDNQSEMDRAVFLNGGIHGNKVPLVWVMGCDGSFTFNISPHLPVSQIS